MVSKKPKLPVQQLLILSICRFAEPVVMTSILPYLPEMIEHVGVPDTDVAKWVGITSAVVAVCQATMAVPWGTASDKFGRKPIILLGLTFTMIFSVVFGFSDSLFMLVSSRAMLGFMNGNVGIIRTMVAEMVPERELQPRAFSIMPLVWTIGSIFGPAFGGALARPAEKHPDLFGRSDFLRRHPFVLPNLLSSVLFIVGITTGFLFLHETLAAKRDRRDIGLMLGDALTQSVTMCKAKRRRPRRFTINIEDDETTTLLEDDPEADHDRKRSSCRKSAKPKRPKWSQIFSPQSNLVLLAYGSMAMHSMAFDSLFPVFLHHPVQMLEGNPDVKLPLKFSGGFGVDSQTIGIFYTMSGIIGMFIQFLVFPAAAKRYGVLTCLKAVSLVFPALYMLTPFTVLVGVGAEGSRSSPFLRNFTVFSLLLAKLAAVIFSFPCCTILLTNSAASLNVLGTLNGVGTSISAIGRAAGPAMVGAMFSYGIRAGYAIIPWWFLAVLSALSAVPVYWIVESDGFQAGGDEEEEEQDLEFEPEDGVTHDSTVDEDVVVVGGQNGNPRR